jgi:hypothetical protein
LAARKFPESATAPEAIVAEHAPDPPASLPPLGPLELPFCVFCVPLDEPVFCDEPLLELVLEPVLDPVLDPPLFWPPEEFPPLLSGALLEEPLELVEPPFNGA